MRRAARVLGAMACGISQVHGAQISLVRRCFPTRVLTNTLVLWTRAGQTTITDATIWAAVEECHAESTTFDCPASQATYGPIEDWDVGAVTSLNNWGAGCTESAGFNCGCASPIRLSDLLASDSPRALAACSVRPVLGLQ